MENARRLGGYWRGETQTQIIVSSWGRRMMVMV